MDFDTEDLIRLRAINRGRLQLYFGRMCGSDEPRTYASAPEYEKSTTQSSLLFNIRVSLSVTFDPAGKTIPCSELRGVE